MDVAKQRHVHQRRHDEQQRRSGPDDDGEEHSDNDTGLEDAAAKVGGELSRPILGFAERVEGDAVDDLTGSVGEEKSLPACVLRVSLALRVGKRDGAPLNVKKTKKANSSFFFFELSI